MKRLKQVIDVFFDKITKQDFDGVLIIGGDEGSGKSHLGLNIMDYWYTKLYGKCAPEQAEKIGLNIKQFVYALKILKQYEIADYDEANDLSSLRMMDKFNYAVTKGYTIIRGANLMTLLTLPDVFYLNPFFSTRRARGYIHVYKRGSFAYWNKPQLRKLIEANKGKRHRNVWRVKPLFHDHYPIYKGPLMAEYMKRKAVRIDEARQELYDKVATDTDDGADMLKLIKNSHTIVGPTKTAKIFEISTTTVYNKLKEYDKMQREATT